MRRVAVESLLVGAAAGALGGVWLGGFDEVCGAGGATLAWRAAHLVDVVAGRAALGDANGVQVPLAGLPWAVVAAGARAFVGDAAGAGLAFVTAVGATAAALWGLARRAGASLEGAALAVAVGGLPTAAVGSLAAGGTELALGAFAALALALLPERSGRARAVGFAALLLAGWCDARAGAVLGLAAFAAGGGGLGLVGALFSTGTGIGAVGGNLDPLDLGAPFLSLRADAIPPGLAALGATAWVLRDVRLRRAAIVAFVLALGPVLRAFGEPLTVAGAAVPLPAVVIAAFGPAGEGWSSALVVAAVAAGLGLARLERPRGALLLGALALLEASRVVGSPPECLGVTEPVAVRALAERTGGVLHLPVRAELDGVPFGAPPGAHALYLLQCRLHGRPVATGIAPLGATHPLYAEPAVILSLGAEELLLPPTRPGDVLRGLGVTEIVLHRALFAPQHLAVIDPLLARLYGAPQRDHAGQVDLYRVLTEGVVRPPTPEALRRVQGAAPAGWLEVGAWLAGLAGPAGPSAPAEGGDLSSGAPGGPAGPPAPPGAGGAGRTPGKGRPGGAAGARPAGSAADSRQEPPRPN